MLTRQWQDNSCKMPLLFSHSFNWLVYSETWFVSWLTLLVNLVGKCITNKVVAVAFVEAMAFIRNHLWNDIFIRLSSYKVFKYSLGDLIKVFMKLL